MEELNASGANPCATVLPSAWTIVQLAVMGSPPSEAEVTLTKKAAVVELVVVAELVELVLVLVVLVVVDVVDVVEVVDEVVEVVEVEVLVVDEVVVVV
jgi:hypothetical protein